jgi:flagellar hook assembly protein FlgD
MLANNKMVKKITKEIKEGTGNFKVNGKSTDGARWPEGNHFWIVDDMIEQKTYHIPVSDVDAELYEANNIGSEV